MKKFNDQEIELSLKTLKDWAYRDGFIEKEFIFKDFKEAIAFMVKVGFEAELLDHHPDWCNVYNMVKIKLQTHFMNGISDKDFTLAHKIEEMLGNPAIQ
jgi:4a-hydroxytetrahydrobiopterin dehydratase